VVLVEQEVKLFFLGLLTRGQYLLKWVDSRRRCRCGMRPAILLGEVIVEVPQEGPNCFWCGRRRVDAVAVRGD
jgi:hypothetical protein